MGRKRVSSFTSRNHRSESGLSVRQRGAKLYISGTVTVRGKSVRVRKSTGLFAAVPENWETAHEIRRATEIELQDQLVNGAKPAPRFAEIVLDYIARHNVGPTDARNLDELNDEFGDMLVSDMNRKKINEFYRRRFPAQSPSTVRRHQNTLAALFEHALDQEMIEAAPRFMRPKLKRSKGQQITKKFLPGEAELIIDCADRHMKPILATLYSTGARVSMTLVLKIEHFILARGRGRVFFPESKNGHGYSRPLHDYTVDVLKDWLQVRDDTHEAMFLTRKNQPYKIYKGRSGYIKGGFDRAIIRATDILRSQGQVERARVISEATPHWFRHNLANTLRQDFKADVKTIMEAGMWESPRVLLENYFSDTQEATDQIVKSMPVGTVLTHKSDAKG